MMSITQSIQLMKSDGGRLAKSIPMEDMSPMTFSCSFDQVVITQDELNQILPECPHDMVEFWGISRTARLFEDQDYGQWGLEILSPESAIHETRRLRAERIRDFKDGDLVVGRFLGDSDMLVLRTDPASKDFGHVIVATPIDIRADWCCAGVSFSDFLDTYVRDGGGKFWEGE